jgi:hypothetical protein
MLYEETLPGSVVLEAPYGDGIWVDTNLNHLCVESTNRNDS